MSQAVKEVKSIAGLCRVLGIKPIGGNYKTMHRYLLHYDLDTAHFTGMLWSKGMSLKDTTDAYASQEAVKNKLKQLVPYECSFKDCPTRQFEGNWRNENLVFHMDHINGNPLDNNLENLRFLCPNCHSQTKTYCARNIENHVSKAKSERQPAERLQPINLCLDCLKQISVRAVRCKPCAASASRPVKFEVSREELQQLLADYSMVTIGKMFGVSDNAIRKRAKRLGLL